MAKKPKKDGDTPKKPIILPLYGPLTWHNTISWAVLIAVVLLIRWAWFEPYTIPSGSMEPTLHGDARILRGDRVFIDKWRYGLRVPFMNKRVFQGTPPERWDIVVFRSPDPRATHPILIKRIVALPGERVHIQEDGTIAINGSPVAFPDPDFQPEYVQQIQMQLNREDVLRRFLAHIDDYVPKDTDAIVTDNLDEAKSFLARVKEVREKLSQHVGSQADFTRDDLGAIAHRTRVVLGLSDEVVASLTASLNPLDYQIIERSETRGAFRYGILTDETYSVVPPGHYLALGDNSENSVDGRYFGWVPEENLYGRAFCIWWPVPRIRDFTGFTQQWYGIFFVYLLPIGLFLWLTTRRFILRTCRIHESALGGTFEVGERLVIDCLAYGLRTPFVRPSAFIKAPNKNDIVLCFASDGDNPGEPRIILGCITAVPGDNDSRAAKKLGPRTYIVACDDSSKGSGEWKQFTVPHVNLIGKAVSVCWPVARRRKITGFDIATLADVPTK